MNTPNTVTLCRDQCIITAFSLTKMRILDNAIYRLDIELIPTNLEAKNRFQDDLRALIKDKEDELERCGVQVNRDRTLLSTYDFISVCVPQQWVTAAEDEVHINQNPDNLIVVRPYRSSVYHMEIGYDLIWADNNKVARVVPIIYCIDLPKANRIYVGTHPTKHHFAGLISDATDEEKKQFLCSTMRIQVYADGSTKRIPFYS